MEFDYLLLLSLLFLVFLKLVRINSHARKAKLPPGPSRLPIIGSIHHMHGCLPHRRFTDLSKIHGPVMHLKLGEISTIVVSSAEAAREFMKTHDLNFSSRPLILVPRIISYGGNSLIFAPYGTFWRQVRKICVLELLSAKRVQSFRSIREEEVCNLVRSIADSPKQVNISRMLHSLNNDITVRTVIGDKCKQQDTFLSALNETVEAAGGFDLVDLFPSSSLLNFFSPKRIKIERIHRKLDGILDDILQQHKQPRIASAAAQREDLLDVLLKFQAGQGDLDVPLTDENLKAIIMDIFGAGSETSTTTLVWAMTELVRHPRVMNKAQSEVRGIFEQKGHVTEDDMEELSYLKLVIKEALRLHVPVPLLIPRECRTKCEIFGYEIPEKARLVVNAWAIARDSQYWGDDAEEFRPERFEKTSVDFKGAHFEFIPFGSGRRMCPGISFATASIELVLAQLLCYFDWELPGNADPKDLNMEETLGATAPRKFDLCLRAIPWFPVP